MGWSGGTFTRTNDTYSGSAVWNDDETNGFDILSTRHDLHDQDLAEGINACLNRDGSNAMTDELPMGGNKVTGLAEGDSAGDAVRFEQMTPLDVGTVDSQMLRWDDATGTYKPVSGALLDDNGYIGLGVAVSTTSQLATLSSWAGSTDNAGVSCFSALDTALVYGTTKDDSSTVSVPLLVKGTTTTISSTNATVAVNADGSISITGPGGAALNINTSGEIIFPSLSGVGSAAVQASSNGKLSRV